MKHTERLGFDTTINGQELCLEFTRTTVWGRENYGADADGNRGMMIDTIDEDDYSEIAVTFYHVDGHSEPIPLADVSLPTDQANLIIQAVEEYMAAHDPKMPEEPEPDYDDIDD